MRRDDPGGGGAGAGGGLLKVVGRSMEPTLSLGWLGHYVPVGPKGPEAGDVVAIRCGAALLVHRVVGRVAGRDGGWIVHQGDASDRCGLAALGEVEGKVVLAGPEEDLRPVPVAPRPPGGGALRFLAVCRMLARLDEMLPGLRGGRMASAAQAFLGRLRGEGP